MAQNSLTVVWRPGFSSAHRHEEAPSRTLLRRRLTKRQTSDFGKRTVIFKYNRNFSWWKNWNWSGMEFRDGGTWPWDSGTVEGVKGTVSHCVAPRIQPQSSRLKRSNIISLKMTCGFRRLEKLVFYFLMFFIYLFSVEQMTAFSVRVFRRRALEHLRFSFDGIEVQGAVAQWKEFCLVTRRLWVQLPPMPLRSNPGQVACLSLFHASDSFTKEWQLACNKISILTF